MKIHIVQKGDTLWEISKKYGVDFEQVKQLNSHLASPDMIMPGMKIKIPSTSKAVKKESAHPHVKESAHAHVKEVPIAAPNVAPNVSPNVAPKEKSKEMVKHPYKEMPIKPMPVIHHDDHKEHIVVKPVMPVQPMPQMPLQPIIQMPIMEQEMQNYTINFPQMPTYHVPKEAPKVEHVKEKPVPKPVPKPAPKPVAKPAPKPVAKPTPKPIPIEQPIFQPAPLPICPPPMPEMHPCWFQFVQPCCPPMPHPMMAEGFMQPMSMHHPMHFPMHYPMHPMHYPMHPMHYPMHPMHHPMHQQMHPAPMGVAGEKDCGCGSKENVAPYEMDPMMQHVAPYDMDPMMQHVAPYDMDPMMYRGETKEESTKQPLLHTQQMPSQQMFPPQFGNNPGSNFSFPTPPAYPSEMYMREEEQ